MSFHIGVVHRHQVMLAREAGIVQFSHGRKAAVERLSPGDKVIYYAPKSDFDGDPVQAFVAHAEVTGEAPYEKHWRQDFTGWVRDAAYDAVTETPVRPLIDTLDFVPEGKTWGVAFRNGFFEISATDYSRLAGALLGGDQ